MVVNVMMVNAARMMVTIQKRMVIFDSWKQLRGFFLNLWVDKTASEQGLNLELLNAEKEKLK